MTDEYRDGHKAGGLMVGVTLMLFGAALMLDRAGLIDGVRYTAFWGLLVMAIGIIKLSHVGPDGLRHGGWWLFFGAWMLLNETRAWRLRESWPLLVVAVGVSMVWKEIAGRRPRARARVE
jgi:cell wall-active antibiotic response 4TMS protein YvqF